MHKYGGKVIHTSRDEHGLIEVVEGRSQRSLHFGSEPKQSSMLLNEPLRLALSYTRAMMTGLLFIDIPKRVLIIGLGGGSIAKFLLHHFPHSHIDAVEYRENVMKLAHSYFQLPEDSRLTTHIQDAGDFIYCADPVTYSEYDLILVDAYDAEDMSFAVSGQHFYQACHKRLSSGGVLTTNLWASGSIDIKDTFKALEGSFPGSVFRLSISEKDNVIAITTNQAVAYRQLRQLETRAKTLEAQLDIEFSTFLKSLKKNRHRWFQG